MRNAIGAIITIVLFAYLFAVCSPAGGNKTGHEYMPDMVHSIAYEANVITDYKYNTWDKQSIFSKAELSRPRYSVDGTIPRGYTAVAYQGAQALDYVRGKNSSNAVAAPVNAFVPFYYGNTEDERKRATAEITANPFPITQEGLDRAKPLYNIYCGVCHGDKGDGQGALLTVPDSKYPAQPANFLNDEFINASNGRYYFAIMHGKNVMGPYPDKLNYEERWQVIHYIRSLQAKSKNLVYSETANTFSGDSVTASQQTPAPATRPAKEPGLTKGNQK
jgi:mono/diheme cytochrome c family protein